MYSLHPGFILIIAGLITLVLPERVRKVCALAGASIALIGAIFLEKGIELTANITTSISLVYCRTDSLSWIFTLVLTAIGFIAGIYSFNSRDRLEKFAALFYSGSGIGVVLAGDWITLICFWEAMAVASVYLVWAGRTHEARRASYRYLVMHFFGGNMLMAGAVVMCVKGNWTIELLTGESGIGYWLILMGIAVNAAIPPFHTWVSDAYPEATPWGTLYMGSFTTKVAIYALIRLFAGTEWLIAVGGFMAVFAACMAFLENDLRRLLSYHIVSQLGMMVAALGAGGGAGIDGATLHALFNILYKGVLLMVAGAIIIATGKRKITELGGLYKKMPLESVCFFICSLAIAGMPGLNGFVSKALVMEALRESGNSLGFWLITIAGVGTWLSITLKINWFVFFGRGEETDMQRKAVPVEMKIAMVAGTVLCVITGLLPSLSYGLAPCEIVAHPYNPEHVLEYLGLFVGATVPFVLLRKKMAPHCAITLDFDWFYRRPFAKVIELISVFMWTVFGCCEKSYNNMAATVTRLLNNPLYIFKRDCKSDEYRPIGDLMNIFIIVLIFLFVFSLVIQ